MQLPFTLQLRPSPSCQLAILLAVTHGVALAAVMLVSLPLWIKFALLASIFASVWRNLIRQRGPHSIVSLTLRGDGWLEFSRQDGSRGEARLHPHTTVTSLMTVLLLRQEGRIEALVLLPDAIESEDFRLLRLWLRWRTARSDLQL